MRHRRLPLAALIVLFAPAVLAGCSAAAGTTSVMHIEVDGDNSPSTTDDLSPRHHQYLVAALKSLDGRAATLSMTYHGASTDTDCPAITGELPDRPSGQDPDWVDAANAFIADADQLMSCATNTMGPTTGSFVFDPCLVNPGTTEVWVLSDGMINDRTVKARPNLHDTAWVRDTAKQLTCRGSLNNKTVRWFGLGVHAHLDRVQAINLKRMWTQVIEGSGGSAVFAS